MSTLTEEKAETEKRVVALKEQTRLERLRKEEIDLERECYRHTSIFEWIRRLFKKGGKE